MNNQHHITAIVLAGGSGTRMGTEQKKQYLLLNNRPLLYYSLMAFEKSAVSEIILVTQEAEYCRSEIIEKYKMKKITQIVQSGEERYHSVYNGLLAAAGSDYVLIHDGARPFLTEDIIYRSIESVLECNACVVGMPVKDTIKIADQDGFAAATPDREHVWMVQTPQSFSYQLIRKAYERILSEEVKGITDDAMVVEYCKLAKVKLIQGSYRNIKITTPEDMEIARIFLN